jgi:hypothetical protein
MQLSTVIRSPSATVLGTLFAVGTAYVLFEDVLRGAAVTTDHVMTALVLVGTIASGHFFAPALSDRRCLLAAGCALLFAAGTFICVTGSASRGAEHDQAKRGAAQDVQAAKAERAEAARAHAKECASGDGKRCKGARAVLEVAEHRLAGFGSAQAVNGFEHASRVFSLLTKVSAAEIQTALELLWPFAKALMLELATIVFLGLGLGHRVKETPETEGNFREIEECPLAGTLRKIGRPVTNAELAEILGVSKGQASKTVSRAGTNIRRERVGRHVQISLN